MATKTDYLLVKPMTKPLTRQQRFLKALAKSGFDLDELQRAADKAMRAGRVAP